MYMKSAEDSLLEMSGGILLHKRHRRPLMTQKGFEGLS